MPLPLYSILSVQIRIPFYTYNVHGLKLFPVIRYDLLLQYHRTTQQLLTLKTRLPDISYPNLPRRFVPQESQSMTLTLTLTLTLTPSS